MNANKIDYNITISFFLFTAEGNTRVPTNVVKCEKCDIILTKNDYQFHLRTELHKSNCMIATNFENVYIINTAFKNRVMTYCIKCKIDPCITPEGFLYDCEKTVYRLVSDSLGKHKCIKIQFELFMFYLLPKNDEKQLKSFNTKFVIVSDSDELKELYETKIIETIMKKSIEFEHSESGWTFFSICRLEININRYDPMRGGTYIKLPPRVGNTKSCINVKNKDEFCFLWSILAGLYPCNYNSDRCSSYPHF